MFITRQSYWHESGAYAVEIAATLDTSGPDALVAKYAGEMEEYTNPMEAVEAAIHIADKWGEDTDEIIPVAISMAGDIVYPSLDDGFDTSDPAEMTTLRAWAQEKFDAMPKCDRCGSVENVTTWHNYDIGAEVQACGQFCADEMFSTAYTEMEDEQDDL